MFDRFKATRALQRVYRGYAGRVAVQTHMRRMMTVQKTIRRFLELRRTHNLEWTKKMTNYTQDEEFFLDKLVFETQPDEISLLVQKEKRSLGIWAHF